MDPLILVFGGVAIILLFILGSFMAALYQKVGPNQAMIISGGGSAPKVIVGGGTIVLPLVNRVDYLSLESMTIKVAPSTAMFTKTNVPVIIEAIAQIKVRGDETSILTAAEQLIGKDINEIVKIAQNVLTGHLRTVVARMSVEELIFDKEKFDGTFIELVGGDFAKMGLTVLSMSITEIQDKVGYIDSLAAKPEPKRLESSPALTL